MLGYKFKGLTSINRRRDRRVPVSLPADVNDTPVLIKDISLSGLAFISENRGFDIGDDVLIEFHLFDVGSIKIGASIVRFDGKYDFGAAFIGLSSDAFKLIENLETGQYRRTLKVA